MTYKISGTIVIDDSKNINATGVTTATSFSGKGMLESGTVCYFFQASAPTGFTKIIANDDCTLRVVSGTGGGTGGATGFSTAFPASPSPLSATQTFDNTTLTTPQLAAHTHPNGISPGTAINSVPGTPAARVFPASGSEGGNVSHTHPSATLTGSADLRVQYIDIISASRDA